MKSVNQLYRSFLTEQGPYLSYCYESLPVLQRVKFSTFCEFAFSQSA